MFFPFGVIDKIQGFVNDLVAGPIVQNLEQINEVVKQWVDLYFESYADVRVLGKGSEMRERFSRLLSIELKDYTPADVDELLDTNYINYCEALESSYPWRDYETDLYNSADYYLVRYCMDGSNIEETRKFATQEQMDVFSGNEFKYCYCYGVYAT